MDTDVVKLCVEREYGVKDLPWPSPMVMSLAVGGGDKAWANSVGVPKSLCETDYEARAYSQDQTQCSSPPPPQN